MNASSTHQALLRSRWETAANDVSDSLLRIRLALRSYNPDQLRLPAGQPGGGRWSGGGSGSRGEAASREPDGRIQVAGGFEPGDMNKTVQDFMSAKCIGKIRGEMPGEFLDMTIGDVTAVAKSGHADARRCLKLLRQDRFRK